MLKWSFLFWIGQVAAMAGLLAFMLGSTEARGYDPGVVDFPNARLSTCR